MTKAEGPARDQPGPAPPLSALPAVRRRVRPSPLRRHLPRRLLRPAAALLRIRLLSRLGLLLRERLLTVRLLLRLT
ncbi:hypothetical protein DB35_11295, partial [Streptomyces abyssalis]